ncbi:RagB/SusD family nutrient uptake outer membrane protein [Chitinophaga agrisoli]|uniref:RagB/SusD family nutrient uptake outer membrane protein n=1 Tax=Chitinophaga agrisoli TaxID=2607653 RepID=A0A5B2VJY8_9BACT|nr:RagB/SusD family nutrient uptake outer membrane protein [Chitinophaga agrisoli]KAA2238537.1 RagB/SusD family nutrient uptake outer membrane protein [Chitinophaga agrisoli]
MKRIHYYILIAALALSACDGKIDDIRPLTKIDKEGELSSLEGIEETTVGAYVMLTTLQRVWLDFGESRGNNVTLQEWAPASKNTDAFFFRNSNGPTSGYSVEMFRSAYQLIVSINVTLEGMRDFEQTGYAGLTQEEKDRFQYARGENLFLRAFTYFNLVRAFGKPYYQGGGSGPSVPLKLSSSLDDVPAPATVAEVYNFIIDELQTAAQLMKAPVTRTNAFATTAAAWALLSRVYLYKGGAVASPDNTANQQVILYTDSVLTQTSGRYALQQGDAYRNMFGDDETGAIGRSKGQDNKEYIFAYDNTTGGSDLGQLFHFDAIYNVGAIFLPSSDLRQQFTAADIRGSFFKLNVNSNYTETTKWLVLNEAWITYGPNGFLRLGEIYLNRAEAAAKLKNYTAARDALTIIHTRAGLPAADIISLPDTDLLTAILKERRLELAFEGHAGYDYFRNGLPMTRIAADNNGSALTIQPDDPKIVFTLPTN